MLTLYFKIFRQDFGNHLTADDMCEKAAGISGADVDLSKILLTPPRAVCQSRARVCRARLVCLAAWTFMVKINDSGDDNILIGGPGEIAFDQREYAWVTNSVTTSLAITRQKALLRSRSTGWGLAARTG
jgi:hypothetical protein